MLVILYNNYHSQFKREWRDGGGEQYTRFRKIFFTAGYNVPDYNESTSYSSYST